MTSRAPRRPSNLAGVPEPRRRVVRPRPRDSAALAAPASFATSCAAHRRHPRLDLCPGAQDRARWRAPPPLTAGRRCRPSRPAAAATQPLADVLGRRI
jgi:hypothetical protein